LTPVALLDVNVLVALFYDRHVHHDVAHDWFTDNADAGWASCPVTESGLLRILGNPARMSGQYVALPKLVELLSTFCKNSRHHFWPDALSMRDARTFNVTALRGHQQLTDVYLLGLAVKAGGKFVTLDQKVPLGAVKGATSASLEIIAPAE
jgi:toxin-antitoxin system PIN domain toxin